MKMLIGVASAFALLAATPAYADVANSVRVGLSVGTYQLDAARVTAFNPDGTLLFDASGASDDAEFSYGLLLGYRLSVSGFFGDIGLELLNVDTDPELNRTDIQFSLGYQFEQGFSVFGGYRLGMQSTDSYFEDDLFEESGPFAGVGGSVGMGDWVLLGSLAYVFNDAQFGGTDFEFDYGGLSARIGVNIAGTPHSVFLRYQNFDGDGAQRFDDNSSLRVELEESYLQLLYQYSIAF